jgi:hypothetical protein
LVVKITLFSLFFIKATYYSGLVYSAKIKALIPFLSNLSPKRLAL